MSVDVAALMPHAAYEHEHVPHISIGAVYYLESIHLMALLMTCWVYLRSIYIWAVNCIFWHWH
jgi:hypothetical protein